MIKNLKILTLIIIIIINTIITTHNINMNYEAMQNYSPDKFGGIGGAQIDFGPTQ